MARLNIAPTKSNLLVLQRQLAFAEEGYDLLEQKRRILVFELMHRLARARQIEAQVTDALRAAHAALREAELDLGSVALDRAALGVPEREGPAITEQHLMGLRIPHVTWPLTEAAIPFGVGGTSASTAEAWRQFSALLPPLAELAELENAVRRLARELRKTQRRCNALAKLFIPDYRETIARILDTLEERERESFVVMKLIRARLATARMAPTKTPSAASTGISELNPSHS